ncbi:SDR family oxidoreductase [Corynebacterium auriscanis]|uniref:Short-chain dehydrogenase n=1 Tax=Corynebacterium auriscanis TaxID=99807 RepID=A0A0A2DMD6_9CORY|nr:SDR family oxidoreductase [Corynebacterium auriscanis]KGM18046.1 short-chain dehydrogenase [Corynebacterium auriscanis]MCX2162359.1 SDR family oxidoreductase [Corynebacterium auriscanis]WJY73185.1 Benzil reductase ((S)-benzoin forming) [Corynebacterium auriscanis]
MNKTAFITGATRGIGLAVAQQLAPDHHLIIGGSSASAYDVAAQFPSAQAFVADLTDLDVLADKVATLNLDRLDVLVHSAGVVAHDPVTETEPVQWRHAFDVNLFAVAELTRQLIAPLRAAHGTLVTINSGAGHHSGVGYGPYAATKFALRAYTDALREEERGKIRVSSVHPGKVDSDMQRQIQKMRGNDYDESLFLRPESVAKAVRFAVDATDEAMIEELTIRPTRS